MLIIEYFQRIESQIADCIHIVESSLLKDRRSLHIGIIEGELLFADESVLHFIEFVNVKDTIEVYKYSYHYQDRNGDLIFRYDMAPHHREMQTFPHHKHTLSNKVIEAPCPTLEQILNEIDDMIVQLS
ncbi:MAG: DUF6516 family protein [Thermodesulfobacteriota bacterium]|nr:DUF6516 family protein [Thermodesulfobacteriota bacterium]